MKARHRYCLLFLFLFGLFAFIIDHFFGHSPLLNAISLQSSNQQHPLLDSNLKSPNVANLKSYFQLEDLQSVDDEGEEKEEGIWKQINVKSGNLNGQSSDLDHIHRSHHAQTNSFEFAANCRIFNCFDLNRCQPGDKLRIHIYPPNVLDDILSPKLPLSSNWRKILTIIHHSAHFEPDPSKACLFVTAFDFLDRDSLSPDFQRHLPQVLPLFNGRNHLLFNIYSGSWPHYQELDFASFNPGQAMLMKASFSSAHYRSDFDVSLPLFSKSHPLFGTISERSTLQSGKPSQNGAPSSDSDQIRYLDQRKFTRLQNERKHLLVFKGKRYVYGQGSGARNMLHHLHNGHDVLIYTTCKHGKKWKEVQDERCVRDNMEYDSADYEGLMKNATFCLVPRGRRLGSYRFLEAMQHGCVPVVLANDWILPFQETLDWDSAVIRADERLLLQLPELLRSIGWRRILQMRAACLRLYWTYFSTVQQIVLTSLKIVSERIQTQLSLDLFVWNARQHFNAFWFDQSYSSCYQNYPGLEEQTSDCESSPQVTSSIFQRNGYTAVIYVAKPIGPSILLQTIKNISKSKYLQCILILWSLPVDPPTTLLKSKHFVSPKITTKIIIPDIKTVNAKIHPYKEIETRCVLTLDAESTLLSEELDFAYQTWTSFPQRIVGFTARDYHFDETKSNWFYTSKWTNQFSLILLDGAFFHTYYAWAFTKHADNSTMHTLNIISNHFESDATGSNICLDLYFNFLISFISHEAPIKVTQRKKTTKEALSHLSRSPLSPSSSSFSSSFGSSQQCFQHLLNVTFGHIPLVKSQARFDPLLFKDAVSNLRKKYRKLELIK